MRTNDRSKSEERPHEPFPAFVECRRGLYSAMHHFVRTLRAVTIYIGDDRNHIPDEDSAAALSDAWNELAAVVSARLKRIAQQPPLVRFALAQLDIAIGFPEKRWKEQESTSPGGRHRRYCGGDEISLRPLDSAWDSIRVWARRRQALKSSASSSRADLLVTLEQAASCLPVGPRQLRRYKSEGKIPPPDQPAKGRAPHRWWWHKTLRPALERIRKTSLEEITDAQLRDSGK